MDPRPATQASKGRRLFRSAIAEAVASDPAQRVLASVRAPGRRSRTPIRVGLGVVAAIAVAMIIGTVLRTGTPGGVTPAASMLFPIINQSRVRWPERMQCASHSGL